MAASACQSVTGAPQQLVGAGIEGMGRQPVADRPGSSLSRREREVMALVVSGLLNKQVGFELGISEITVKAHRGKVMRKMKAGSLADLVNMAASLRLAPAPIG